MFNLNGENIVGKSYVIFGKTDTSAIDLTKLSGNSKYAINHLGNDPCRRYLLECRYLHQQRIFHHHWCL
jgi:hypothetical protein